MNAPVDVVLVAEPDDSHAMAVNAALIDAGASTARVNLTDLRAAAITARAHEVEFRIDDARVVTVTSATTIWWRRLGQFDVEGLDHAEARLAEDEAPEILRGAFLGAAVRWVDEPFTVTCAETKQYQLARARACGIPVPDYLVTSDVSAARRFAVGRELVAKPLSSGIGIAPFTSRIEYADLPKVATLPTLLQELVYASADLRVVVVRESVWAWRRCPRGWRRRLASSRARWHRLRSGRRTGDRRDCARDNACAWPHGVRSRLPGYGCRSGVSRSEPSRELAVLTRGRRGRCVGSCRTSRGQDEHRDSGLLAFSSRTRVERLQDKEPRSVQ